MAPSETEPKSSPLERSHSIAQSPGLVPLPAKKTEKGDKDNSPWERLAACRSKEEGRHLARVFGYQTSAALQRLLSLAPSLCLSAGSLGIQMLAAFTEAHLAGRSSIRVIGCCGTDCSR